ncbi:MAG TPA: ABC transporter ATP-binding protein [Gallionella sp.]|nr:ABC transporter ATP-binding protein [Gallionella sp.]
MLQCNGITKTYGSRRIFDNLSYRFAPGVYAIQGPNGIGKSTLLGVLSGAIQPDAGDVLIDGISLTASPLPARQRLSYVPDESPVYPFMTGRDLLDFVAMAKQTTVDAHILQLVERFGLNSHLHSRFEVMSLGTQKKFMLCAAWIGDPQAIFMDEPSNGLDTAARELLESLIRERRPNRLILFSTHDADFVAACNAQVLSMAQIFAGAI